MDSKEELIEWLIRIKKSREPITNESDVFSALVFTLLAGVDDKLL